MTYCIMATRKTHTKYGHVGDNVVVSEVRPAFVGTEKECSDWLKSIAGKMPRWTACASEYDTESIYRSITLANSWPDVSETLTFTTKLVAWY